MGSCLSSSAAVVEPEVIKVIETAVQGAVHSAVVQLLADLHLSINMAKENGGIVMEPTKFG